MSSRIVMKVFDQDNITDEIVGSLLFNIKDCIDKLVNYSNWTFLMDYINIEWKIFLEKCLWITFRVLWRKYKSYE